MANKREDVAAAKAKKQKIILIVGGVLLLAVAAIQGPKLMKGSSSTPPPKAAAPATTPTPAAPAASVSNGGSATIVEVSGAPRPTAILAGVKIQGGGAPVGDAGQLIAFSLFNEKDPFEPQTSGELSGTTEPTSTPTLSDTQPGTSDGGTSGPGSADAPSGGGGGSGSPAADQPATTNATIMMNGKPYYLSIKDQFPRSEPVFVLASLKPKVARIGVAGGAFADGKTIPLAKGKKVTLVNDATGARYVLKLVYTGSVPEQTESFTQAPAK